MKTKDSRFTQIAQLNSPFGKTDSYKLSHWSMLDPRITMVYSNMTPRYGYFDWSKGVIFFGFQAYILKLEDLFNTQFFNLNEEKVRWDFNEMWLHFFGTKAPEFNLDCVSKLHKIGYLPLEFISIPEGTYVPYGTPCFTIHNTSPEVPWLTNWVESWMSAEIWHVSTSATTANQYRKVFHDYMRKTSDLDFMPSFQGHDFSFRGMSNLDAAASSGAGHVLSFQGSDTVPVLNWIYANYPPSKMDLICTSVPASEHSCVSSGTLIQGDDVEVGEMEYLKGLITKTYPKGIISYVSDTYDFWNLITKTLPELKDVIMARDGKLVVRPDSGDPVEILCGKHYYEVDDKYDLRDYVYNIAQQEVSISSIFGSKDNQWERLFLHKGEFYKAKIPHSLSVQKKNISLKKTKRFAEEKGLIQCLWDIFGGEVNSKGYKQLDSHIGAIYGDSITLERQEQILSGLEKNGFSSTNVVLGIGSYTYQYCTRDSHGWAIKATAIMKENEVVPIYKDPKTGSSKKSHKGLLKVVKEEGEIVTKQNVTWAEVREGDNLMQTVWCDGEWKKVLSFNEVRSNVGWIN